MYLVYQSTITLREYVNDNDISSKKNKDLLYS